MINAEQVVKSKEYIALLSKYDPDGSVSVDLSFRVSEMKPFCNAGNKNYSTEIHIAHEVARNTIFFWTDSASNNYGIYFFGGRLYVACLSYQNSLEICGDSISNWVCNAIGQNIDYTANEFISDCARQFGVNTDLWDEIYPDLDSLL